MDKCIKLFLNKHFWQKLLKHTVPKKIIIFSFTISWYLFPLFQNRQNNKKSVNSNISFCKIKIIFKSSTQLANFSRFKDKVPLCFHSNIFYKFARGRCNTTYYGKTSRRFHCNLGWVGAILPTAGFPLITQTQ